MAWRRASEGSTDSGSPVHRSGSSVSGRARHLGPGILPHIAYQWVLRSALLPRLLPARLQNIPEHALMSSHHVHPSFATCPQG